MDKISVWCDGGGNNAGDRVGGIGVVLIYEGNLKIICEGFEDTTNNRMEITAVIHGLQNLKKKKIPVEVYSDSAYTVNCFIQGWYHKWIDNGWENSEGEPVANVDLWKKVIKLYQSFNKIEFNKVKGHIGIKYNELADLLATIAMTRISKQLTNKEIISIIENNDNKPKRFFVSRYGLTEKQWKDFRTKGKDWLELLKEHLE